MENILIASASQSSVKALTELLKPFSAERTVYTRSAGEARRQLDMSNFDALIINAPLPDEFGHELALLASDNNISTLLIVKNEIAEEIEMRTEGNGVFVLSKPINRQIFTQAVRFICISQSRVLKLTEQMSKLQTKFDDLKIISKAKCLLLENMGITEAEAHRMIEKEAMNKRMTRRIVAENILKNYED